MPPLYLDNGVRLRQGNVEGRLHHEVRIAAHKLQLCAFREGDSRDVLKPPSFDHFLRKRIRKCRGRGRYIYVHIYIYIYIHRYLYTFPLHIVRGQGRPGSGLGSLHMHTYAHAYMCIHQHPHPHLPISTPTSTPERSPMNFPRWPSRPVLPYLLT